MNANKKYDLVNGLNDLLNENFQELNKTDKIAILRVMKIISEKAK